MRTFIAIALVFAACLRVACGSPNNERLQCAADSDCRQPLGCSFNICHLKTSNDLVVDIALTPPSSSSLITQHLTDVRLDESPFRATLLDPVVLKGDVVKATNRARVNGTITARTPGDISGTGFVFVGKSSGDGYQISLLPGREYLVSFRPDNDAIPPHTLTWSAMDTAGDNSLDIVLPDDAYSTISGVVAWKDGLGAEGATVTAYALTGLRLTQTVTESWRGYFTMKLPPGTASVSLRVQSPATGAQFPALATLVEVGESVIVAVKPPREPVPLEILVTNDDSDAGLPPEPLPNVGLTFVLNDTQGLESASTTTDGLGVASVELLPGSYAVTIIPDGQSRYAAKAFELTVNDTERGAPQLESVTLSPRVAVNGFVGDETEQAVDGKIVFKRHSDDAYPTGLASTKTDVLKGEFIVALDPGVYEVSFIPATQTQAPPYTWRNMSIVDDMPQYDLKLPPPDVIAMEVVDARGQPVANCQVQVFQSASGGEVAFGSDYTDPTGLVVLPVPHEPSSPSESPAPP